MVRMSTVWDRTSEVLQGRFALLATVAGILGVLPGLAQQAYFLWAAGGRSAVTPQMVSATMGGGMAALSILVGLLAIWNGLALVAASSDPHITSAGRAIQVGLRRLPLTIAISLALLIALVVVIVVPLVLAGAGSELSHLTLRTAATGPALAGGTAFAVLIVALLLFIVLLWVSARLILLNPVIVNESCGFASIARSFELTRGLALRVIGMLILFGIVFLVVSAAVQFVIGIVLALLFGAGSKAALFLTAAVSTIVSSALVIVFTTFTAQLYRLATGREAAETFE